MTHLSRYKYLTTSPLPSFGVEAGEDVLKSYFPSPPSEAVGEIKTSYQRQLPNLLFHLPHTIPSRQGFETAILRSPYCPCLLMLRSHSISFQAGEPRSWCASKNTAQAFSMPLSHSISFQAGELRWWQTFIKHGSDFFLRHCLIVSFKSCLRDRGNGLSNLWTIERAGTPAITQGLYYRGSSHITVRLFIL